jgi:flagellar protein FliS
MTPLRHALNEYHQTSVTAGVAYADPHTLISMLFEGLQARLATAKGAMERGDSATKGDAIGKAMDIVSYLQACLDKSKGGEVAENLDALYDYMVLRLIRANAYNEPRMVDEVGGMIRTIASGWNAIRDSSNHTPRQALAAIGA